jgi:hypothetical protein
MTVSPTNPTNHRPPRSLKAVRGRPFEKGRARTGGRPPGGQNVTSRNVREMIIAASEKVGGLERICDWIRESEINERLWWTQVWPRLLPLTVRGAVHAEVDVNVKLTAEELTRKLTERNLPVSIFGIDEPAPMKQIEANGAAASNDAGTGGR